MRIGLCTTDFSAPLPARELFRRISAMGYDAVQLAFASVSECGFRESPHIEIPESVSVSAIDAILKASSEFSLPIGAVNGTWNMAHGDEEVRLEGLKRLGPFLDAVAELGVKIVSLCSGTRSSYSLWSSDNRNIEIYAWNDMAESMKRACEDAEARDITLAIETEASNIIDTPEKARRIMDEVGSDKLKMILDGANLFHKGEAKKENVRPALDLAFRYFGRDIVLAHGKDIREGNGIDFCGTGFGIVDFPYMLEKLREIDYPGDMMLHGIFDEKDMVTCLQYMKSIM
ncbi:MAG: sugar phosphate isomerase/epimerase [Clostridiales bacterium]|nr:sugar phosphate isomerase/epimerase [Clostridiales bacterium]